MNTIEDNDIALVNNNDYSQYKDVNTLQSLKELVNERERKASSYADEIYEENSDYVNFQEWKHYLEKVSQ